MPRFFIYFVLLSCTILAACTEQTTHKPIIKSVITVNPLSPDARVTRTLSGVIQPADQSVLSFEIPGIVSDVYVNLGDKFEKGDELARIDDKVFRLTLQQRKGQLSETQARLNEAEIDFKRKQQLVSSGAVSEAELDVAQSRFLSLRDQVDIAKTQVALAEENLADTRLIAPFNGSVAERHIEPSQQISQSSPVLTLQGSNALEVAVFVPESLILTIAPGDLVDVDVRIENGPTRLNGRVFEVGKQAQRANAFPVTVSLEQNEELASLQPGMSSEVSFVVEESNLPQGTLQAPLSAIAADSNNSHFIYALTADDNANTYSLEKVAIEVVSMNAQSAVFKPVRHVDEIVKTGLDFLRDGQTVFKTSGFPRTANE